MAPAARRLMVGGAGAGIAGYVTLDVLLDRLLAFGDKGLYAFCLLVLSGSAATAYVAWLRRRCP